MKIGELATRTGVNASAIRYYEKCGVLTPPYRISGQRRYAADAAHRVLLIRFASDMGFTLGETKLFLNGLRDRAPVGPRWRKLAHQKIKEVEENIQRARRLKSLLKHLLRCQCASLQICVNRLRLSRTLRLIHSGRTKNGLRIGPGIEVTAFRDSARESRSPQRGRARRERNSVQKDGNRVAGSAASKDEHSTKQE